MARRLFATAAFGLLLAGFQSAAFAQNITVQQPVIRSFGVGTAVSVPDSGRAFLGRVASAGETQKRYGSFPSGTSTGWFRQHAGMSVHATIHNLHEMDERLLREAVNSARIPTGRRLSGNAEHAYRSLISRYESRTGRQTALHSRRSLQRSATTASEKNSAALFYRLGLQAERRGHHSLALRHFRIAAKSGSKAAQERLAAPRLAARSR